MSKKIIYLNKKYVKGNGAEEVSAYLAANMKNLSWEVVSLDLIKSNILKTSLNILINFYLINFKYRDYLVHSHFPFANFMVLDKSRLITTYHGFIYGAVKSGFWVDLMTRLLRKFLSKSQKIICVSEILYNEIQSLNKSSVIINNPSMIADVKSQRLDVDFEDNDYYLYVGRLVEEKGISDLIEFFGINDKYNLVIIGDGPMINSVQRAAQSNNIKYLGYCNKEQLAYAYTHCKAYITFSYYESFCLPVLEAASFGKPAFVSKRAVGAFELNKIGALVKGFDSYEELIYIIENTNFSIELSNLNKDYKHIFLEEHVSVYNSFLQ